MTPRLCEWHTCGRVIPRKGKRFCSRICAGRAAARGNSFVPHARTWQENPPKVVSTDSWWIGISPDEFYAEARRRHPELARKYGSSPVSTVGPREPGFNERARRAKDHARAQLDRVSA